MTLDPRTPVIVGVGQFLHRAAGVDDAMEPAALMEAAIVEAASDAGLDGPPAVDSIRVVSSLSWRYGNPAWIIAQRLGQQPRELAYTSAGGNTPQTLVNRTALDILAGKLDTAVLVGGEAWRTRMRARKTGAILDWPKAPEDQPPVMLGAELDMTHPAEAERGVYLPVQIYPMFETAIRAAAGRSPDEHLVAVSELWSRFSDVAAANPHAWLREAKSAEEIRTTSPTNRLVGLPYRKYMNSNNDVDMAAAVIICSVEAARRLGVAEDRWVFPHSGTDCHEHAYVSNRDTFARTPAVELRRPPRARAGRHRHRRRRHRRPLLLLPRRRAARRAVARAVDRPPADPDGRAGVRRRAVEQLRDARHRHRRRRPPRAAGRAWAGVGQRWLRDQARLRRLRHRAAGRRASATTIRRPRSTPCRAASWRRPRTPPARRPIEAYTVMHGRDGDARAGHRHLPARRRPAGVGRCRATPT